MTTPVLPVVHLNGTSARELLALREDAHRKLLEVHQSLNAMTPHMRDYYPVPGLYVQAAEQHERRVLAIQGLADELETEIEQIAANY